MMKKIDKTFLRWAIGIVIGCLLFDLADVLLCYLLHNDFESFLALWFYGMAFIPQIITYEVFLFFVKFLIFPKKSVWLWFLKIPEFICALCNGCFFLAWFTSHYELSFLDMDFYPDWFPFVWYLSFALIILFGGLEGIIWYLNRRKKKKKEVAESEETTI